jgi:branched-chain amino acid transport system permease protein
MPLDTLIQCVVSGIALGSIYAMIAIGFNIIYNSTGVINFAQGEFAMLGAMLMVYFSRDMGMPLAAAFAGSVAAVTLTGVVFERLAIRPVRKAGVLVLILITIGASFFLKGVGMFISNKNTFYMDDFTPGEPISVFGAAISTQQLWVLGVLAVVVLCLEFFFRLTMTGKAMRACAVNRTAARLMGIDVSKMVMLSFALSAAIGAVGGAVVVPITTVEYESGAMLGLKGFSAAVLGGLGNMPGAVVAGMTLGVLESVSAYKFSAYKNAIALAVLLIVLFVRPSGILGKAEESALREF